MAEANAWLEKYREFWEVNYKRLDSLLDVMKTAETKKKSEVKRKNE
jgi:hypothetical protein